MATPKRGLGKGLDALIAPPKNSEAAEAGATDKKEAKAAPAPKKNPNDPDARMVSINLVENNRNQPRKEFAEDELEELADSIKTHGIVEPITVVDRGSHFEIVAGERRWRAAKLAGLKEVPVVVRNYTEKQIVEISIIENLQRVDLNAIEMAQAYKRLMDEFDLTQDGVAERVSKSRTAITNTMRLLNLDERVQNLLIQKVIKEGQARALLGIKDKEKQYDAAMMIVDKKLSTREVEKLVKDMNTEKKPVESNAKTLDPQLQAIYHGLEETMKGIVGSKVSINYKDENKGKIEIEYFSPDELDRIVDLIRTIQK